MNHILNVPIFFNKSNFIDKESILKLINMSSVDKCILFSPILEGNILTYNEKIRIYSNLKKNTTKEMFYEVSSFLSNDELIKLQKINIDALVLTLIKDKKISQNGHVKYILSKTKNLDCPFYIHHEKGMQNAYLNYYSLLLIKRLRKNFRGIIEDNKDYNLINKLIKINDFEVITDFDVSIDNVNYQVESNYSALYPFFYDEIDNYFKYKNVGIINPVLEEYFKYINQTLDDYPISSAIKYMLNKKYNFPIYSRLPYINFTRNETLPLDFILF